MLDVTCTEPEPAADAAATTRISEAVACRICATSTPSSLTDTTDAPEATRRTPVMVTTVPTWPDEGATVLSSPGCEYVKAALRVVTAPESATSVTPTSPAGAPSITTTTDVAATDTISRTGTPPNSTSAMVAPPANRPVPATVTKVPFWPDAGVTEAMTPSGTYVNAPAALTIAPVVAVSTTSPATFGVPPAATVTTTVDAEPLDATYVAVTPASVTLARSAAPPSSRWPEMVTSVPVWPLFGVTAVTAPSANCSQPPTRTVNAPVSASTATSPVPAGPLPATATTRVSVCPTSVVLRPPRRTATTASPPPRSDKPSIVTRVPS